jgi:uncharacterized protein (DUF302 family)
MPDGKPLQFTRHACRYALECLGCRVHDFLFIRAGKYATQLSFATRPTEGENMKRAFAAALSLLFIAVPLPAADGVINVRSDFTVEETADRLERVSIEKGMIVFKRIKHSEGAGKAGIQLRETELIIFGNPKVGAPLMKCQQSVAIDLPQKALIWEDEKTEVWISYNDPRYLEKRHGLSGCEEVISKIEKALMGITKAASTK